MEPKVAGTYWDRRRSRLLVYPAVKPVGSGGEPKGLPRLATRLFSRSHEAPPHPLSPSRFDPRAKAQVAVTTVSWGSVLPHPAVPCLQALRSSSAALGITSRCPGASSGASSGLKSPHVGLRGLQ